MSLTIRAGIGILLALTIIGLLILLRRDSFKFENSKGIYLVAVSGDNVFEKRGIGRDTAGDGEKTRYFQGKRPLFSRETAGGSHFLCPGRTASVASPFSCPPAAQDGPGRRRRPRTSEAAQGGPGHQGAEKPRRTP